MKAEPQAAGAAGAVLDRILAATARRVEASRAYLTAWEHRAAAAPAPPSLAAALRGPTLAVIAEIKRGSPSAGTIRRGANAAELARTYARAGAAAISVLTEPDFFQGSLTDLTAVTMAVPLPALRKDFVIDPVQILEARAAGAAAVLLIVRILTPERLAELARLARDVGLETLIEVHEERELEAALALSAAIVGVNARDLDTLALDPARVLALLPLVPPAVTAVAESGIGSREDMERVAAGGADAVLVGTRLAGVEDPAAVLAGLLGVPRRGRPGGVEGDREARSRDLRRGAP